ncbi:MAG: hypothetical protein GTN62_00180 [Gemmatimonadales bacterium]|nr:hypothetical protein [Gemmatimonadales bacterium]NIN09822.1 hypothetical protein [Gemmatimonadales bacterium]NIN48525.1 hypothetical protein [Gemmatimonadales bacterium]NIP05989.1 hypothetical protein [Gemmatimonadales bacterium]NIR01139.1 hypothetical protein [Gemmatimonadales bacterium]
MALDGPDTPVTYSREELREIRDSMAVPGAPPVCPLCGRELTVGKPIARSGDQGTIWHVRCKPCRRSAFVKEEPAGHRPEPGG